MDAKWKALFNEMDRDVERLQTVNLETQEIENVKDLEAKSNFLRGIYLPEAVDHWHTRTRRIEFKAKDKELRNNRRTARKFKLSQR
jgi:hypothetical protein